MYVDYFRIAALDRSLPAALLPPSRQSREAGHPLCFLCNNPTKGVILTPRCGPPAQHDTSVAFAVNIGVNYSSIVGRKGVCSDEAWLGPGVGPRQNRRSYQPWSATRHNPRNGPARAGQGHPRALLSPAARYALEYSISQPSRKHLNMSTAVNTV